MVKDPVCGKEIDPKLIDTGNSKVMGGAVETNPDYGTKRFHDGKWYYFCSLACRQKFISGPELYVKSGGA